MVEMGGVPDVSIRVLGPVEVVVDGVPCDLPSRRQRALLTALVVRDGRPVSVTDLVDAVWDDDPPGRARTTLQTYVSRLRGLVGQDTILHSPAGYRLGDNVTTDLAEVREFVEEFVALDRSDPHCTEAAERAFAKWRGPALSEFEGVEWFRPFVVELTEMRSNLIDIVAEGMIHTERCPQAVTALELSLASDPLREPTQILLVRALHGAGRNTDAVRAAARYRRALRETTGLVPGAAFADIEQLVLAAGEPTAAPAAAGNRDEAERTSPDRVGPGSSAPDELPSGWTSTSLPRPTPLIGRVDDLSSIGRALDFARLATVVGVGGVGKTRLVAEFIQQASASSSVLSIELAAVEPSRVLATVGAALGLRDERIGPALLTDAIGAEAVLLVLDNAEHVIEVVRDLVRHVLAACPNAQILVTSRERLALSDEVVVTLEPLSVDGPDAHAVTLFVDRLRRARPHTDVDTDDATIAEMCRRLDGIPLALELTASRAATLGVSLLNERFDAMLGQLVDIDTDQDRHSTLGNVVDWSVELLSPRSQDLLAALSVFRGDFTIDAAEAVGRAIGATAVEMMFGRLVDTSLVAEGSQAGQFRLLEMIRGVARQRLTASEYVAEVRRAHAEWVADRLIAIDADSVGPMEVGTLDRLDAIRREFFDALEWSIDSGNIAIAASIVTSVAGPLLYRPDNELITAIRGIGGHRSISGSPHEPAIVAADARAAFLLGDLDDVAPLAERALRAADADDLATRHRATHALGVVSLYRGDFDESRDLFQRIVGHADVAIVQRMDALGGLALALCYANDLGRARHVAEEHRAISDTIGSDTYIAFADYVLAEIDLATGNIDAAARRFGQSADRAWRARAQFVWGIASTVLARVLVRHRPPADARQHLPVLIDRWRRSATWPQLWTTLRLSAEHLAGTDDPRTALLILEAADRDSAAPSLAGEDERVYQDVRRRIRTDIGEAAATGIASGSAVVDRLAVVARTQAALRVPVAP